MCGGGGFIGDVFDSVGDAFSDAVDVVSDFTDDVLDVTMPITLDIITLGNGDSAWYSLSGDKYRDEKALAEKADRLSDISKQMESLQDRLSNKVFLEQIFKYGDIRRIKDLGTSYEQLLNQYNDLLNDYNNNQDGNFIAGMTNFLPNVMSTFVYSVLDYIKTGDEASLRTAISIGLLVAVIVASILAAPETGGSTLKLIALSLAALSAIMTLDSMVNNSGLLGVAFKILDTVLNKVLQVDSVLHTEGFDDDSQYYESMMNNTRLVVQIAAIATNLYNYYLSPSTPTTPVASGQESAIVTEEGMNSISGSIKTFMNDVSSYEVGGVSLSDMYKAYSEATNANDIYKSLTLHSELQDKLSDAKDEMQKQITKANRQKMEGSYSDASYIANQVDMSYHSYVLAMSEAGQSDVFDPEGTIVMNTRYSPKKSVIFGFEDMFQYDGMAGGELYIYNTLWK